MAYEALHSLIEILNQILKLTLHAEIHREIISIHDEAAILQMHLKNIPKNLEDQIREAANSVEEIIQYIFSEDNPLYGGSMKLNDEVSAQLHEAAEYFKSTAGDVVHSVNSKRRRLTDISPSASSSTRIARTTKDVVVGIEEDLISIICRLIDLRGPPKLEFLSIVGAGGTGKTTLAKLVYNDELIVNRFDIRAWITISQDYTVGSILSHLLASLERQFRTKIDGHGEIPMMSLIRKYLERRRFLIVIDDMCSEKVWDDLRNAFPNTNFRSWIILTTRLHDVASYVDSSTPSHTMRLLNEHHSWNLLRKKVFADESCPPELEDVGKQIVKNYGGLPLSIVVGAGILSKIPKTRYSWKQFAANDGNLDAVIFMSYNHLPDYMRACFLYMGGFPEDYEIRVSQLIKLWIAEGILKCPTRSKTPEEEAVEVLENLVERSLVLVGRRKFDGKIKSCSLHDIVRDFCIKQAQQMKFFLSVMDYLPTPILRKHFLPRVIRDYGRISVSSHDLDLKDSTHSSTHSIICIPHRGYRCVSSLQKFTSLRVFHVLHRNDNWEWGPSQLFDLIHLTYLASGVPTNIIPPTISKLQNLQTLVIYKSEVVLPVEIWMLRQLKHLRAFSFNSLPCPDGATLPLENLETISLVTNFECSERMLKVIPNMKNLGICFYFNLIYHIRDTEEDAIRYPTSIRQLPENFGQYFHCLINLGHLRRLEQLKLESKGLSSFGKLQENPGVLAGPLSKHVFPLSLKKLTLCGLGLPWKHMRIIGLLPNLQVLKLRNYACSGYYWETSEGEFGELRFLLIDKSYLEYWITQGSNFRKLECLILLNCSYELKIPGEIRNIPTLQHIEMDKRRSVYSSVKKLRGKRLKTGNDSFQVRVKPH